jgi:hypothetical protein
MGVGYLGLFDATRHTGPSEYADRGTPVTTLQAHHTAFPSDEGSYDLMLPGGRTVSANGLLLMDATLVEVVPGHMRAYTSSSSADRWCITVEVVNQSGGPGWDISEVQRKRLAKLAREMAAAGILSGGVAFVRAPGGIIGHNETPGSYATACPGPSMNLDHVAALARLGDIEVPAIDYALLRRQKEDTMYVKSANNNWVYNVFTDANGAPRMRLCSGNEAAFATKGGLVIVAGADAAGDKTLENMAAEMKYQLPVVPQVTLAS